jgi:hypothetical protein
VDRESTLARLKQAIGTQLSEPEQSAEYSRLVETVIENELLDDMLRSEVEATIGRGDPCSRHPRCMENNFDPGDWFYTVGIPGESHVGTPPLLIVGFDQSGRVVQTWNLRTH